MLFKAKPPYNEVEAKKKWHSFFIIWPRKLYSKKENSYFWVFLQKVQRKGTFHGDWGGGSWDWEYRIPNYYDS